MKKKQGNGRGTGRMVDQQDLCEQIMLKLGPLRKETAMLTHIWSRDRAMSGPS